MNKLKAYRERRGIKQIAVANALGVSRQTYSKWENNQEEMSVTQAKAACKFLGCPIDKIFFVK